MVSSVDRTADQVDALIAMIAHDLRSPITAIKGFGQLALREADLSPQVRSCLSMVIEESNRLASMIDDLAFLVRPRDRAMIRVNATAIAAMVQAAIARSRQRDPELEVALETAHPDILVHCDPLATERAIALLIGTIHRYDPGGEQIVLRVERYPGGTVVAALPKGRMLPDPLPIPRGVLDSDWTAPLPPGGLGLYVCQRLIGEQGGQVWIDASDDTCPGFALLLPDPPEDHQTSPRGDCQQWS